MAKFVNLGDLPSWIVVVILGFAVVFVSQNGLIEGFEGLGRFMIFGGLILGAIYFGLDLDNKI